MTKHLLSKSTYVKSLQCQKALYLHKKRPFLRDKMSAAQLAKFRRGTAVGLLARELFPGGIDMTPKSPSQYQLKRQETMLALDNPKISTLYEAVFQYDDVLIMLDILVREGDKWRAIEVKSSRGLTETYMQDACLQYYVLKGNKLSMHDFELFYINENYVLKESLNIQELFISQSILKQAEAAIAETSLQIQTAKETLRLTSSPEVQIGTHCYKPYPCDFIGHCWKNVAKNSILYLSSEKLAQRFSWYYHGFDFAGLPENKLLKEQFAALQENSFFLDQKMLETAIADFDLTKPAYLKLLIHQPAIPLISGSKPYQSMVLAACAYLPEEAEAVHFWNWDEGKQATAGLSDYLNNICENSSCIIVFEQYEPSIEAHELSGLMADFKWLNYFNLLQQARFMLPAIEEKPDQKLIQNHLFPDIHTLKDEAWLVKDTLDSSDNRLTQVNFQLLQYCKGLHQLHQYFIVTK